MSVKWSLVLLLVALAVTHSAAAQPPGFWPQIDGSADGRSDFAPQVRRHTGKEGQRDDGGRSERRRGGGLDAAVAEARQRYGGRVLSAETQESDGRRTHVIRILMPDGRVKRLQVDGDGGR